MTAQRAIRGQVAYHDGRAAEDRIERHYRDTGHSLVNRRWRGRSGEIDLVMRLGDEVIFVEVKKARDFDRAAERLQPRQIGRLQNAALEFLAGEPRGMDTDMRFDVALVNGHGGFRIVENALAYA
jgi:putative endonuclease